MGWEISMSKRKPSRVRCGNPRLRRIPKAIPGAGDLMAGDAAYHPTKGWRRVASRANTSGHILLWALLARVS